MKNKIFYTDGSSLGNPGPGGFGVIQLEDNTILYKHSEFFDNTTNNRMELAAILYVLDLANQDPEYEYIIYSDSAYSVNIINSWMWEWAKNNWTRDKGKEIKNLDLVEQIYYFCNKPFFNATVKKCSGHNGVLGNELADALSNKNVSKYERLLEKNKVVVNCI